MASPAVKNATRSSNEKAPRTTVCRPDSLSPRSARIIAAVRKKNKVAHFWYTETGGVVNFGSAFPCDKARAANRTKFMFGLLKTYDKQIDRLYSYNWFGNGCTPAFDGGLVEANGTPRKALTAFKKGLKNTQR